jgi:hypothetical protein
MTLDAGAIEAEIAESRTPRGTSFTTPRCVKANHFHLVSVEDVVRMKFAKSSSELVEH